MLLQLRYVRKKEVGEDLHVRPYAREQHGENRTVQNAIGMIGHNHDRTVRWDPLLIGRADTQTDSHLREQGFETKSLGRALHSPVQISRFADRGELSRQSRKLSHMRQHFTRRRLRMQMV